jgi:predicted ATP-grasp superfamily ATP-dependent carboligase
MMHMTLLVPMQNKPTIVIAALSSRPYAKAAVEAGFDVIAIDAFVDQDTQAMAKQTIQVSCLQQQFDAQAMLDAIDTIPHASVLGFCFGAGFEAQPELLEQVQQRIPLFGNSASTVAHCKDPNAFAQFCQQHHFAMPMIAHEAPAELTGWLIKSAGGSGGAHIHYADGYSLPLAPNQYFQHFQSGLSISCLFLASGGDVHMVGVNEQWLATDTPLPFQYGGAVSHLELEANTLEALTRFITLATTHFHLKGLNSVDALLDNTELYFLEINPRLSATIDLYTTEKVGLFASHVDAFQSQCASVLKITHQPKAHHVVYAKQITHIQAQQVWPEWVSDIPSTSQTFDIGMPICTVVSVADSVQAAKQLVQARAVCLTQ